MCMRFIKYLRDSVSFLVISLSLCLFSSVLQAQTTYNKKTLKIGICVDNRPYGYLDAQAKPQGYNVDYSVALMEELGMSYTLQMDTKKELLEQLDKGTIDLIFGYVMTRDYMEKYAFTFPYQTLHYVMVTRYKSAYNQVADLHNKEVVTSQSGIGDYLLPLIDSTFQVRKAFSTQRGLDLLLEGRYDALFGNEVIVRDYLEALGVKQQLRMFDAHLLPLRYAAITRLNNTALIDFLNEGLFQLKLRKTDEKINNKWFNDIDDKTSIKDLYLHWSTSVLLIALLALLVSLFAKAIREYRRKLSYTRYVRMVIENVPFSMIIQDVTHVLDNPFAGEMIYVSRRYRELYNPYSVEERMTYMTPATIEQLKEDYEAVVKGMQPFKHYRCVELVDGRKFHLMIYMELIPFQKKYYILTTSLDVHEIILAQEKAKQADRAKYDFLLSISHQVRTPLNSILGFSQLLPELEDPVERKEYLKIISEKNQELSKLLTDILLLSKIESVSFRGIRKRLDISAFLEERKAFFAKDVAANPEIDFQVDKLYEYAYSKIYGPLLQHVVDNFLSNAIKNTTTGFIRIGYIYYHGESIIYCHDSGCGMAREDLSTIFDRFEKIDVLAKGTGLGLTICKTVAKLEDAKIGVVSTLGVGSLFWFSKKEPYRGERDKKVDATAIQQLLDKRWGGIWFEKGADGDMNLKDGREDEV